MKKLAKFLNRNFSNLYYLMTNFEKLSFLIMFIVLAYFSSNLVLAYGTERSGVKASHSIFKKKAAFVKRSFDKEVNKQIIKLLQP